MLDKLLFYLLETNLDDKVWCRCSQHAFKCPPVQKAAKSNLRHFTLWKAGAAMHAEVYVLPLLLQGDWDLNFKSHITKRSTTRAQNDTCSLHTSSHSRRIWIYTFDKATCVYNTQFACQGLTIHKSSLTNKLLCWWHNTMATWLRTWSGLNHRTCCHYVQTTFNSCWIDKSNVVCCLKGLPSQTLCNFCKQARQQAADAFRGGYRLLSLANNCHPARPVYYA